MGLMLGLAPPVFKIAPEFCLAPKIKLAPRLKAHTKSSLCLHLLILTKIIKIVVTGCHILRRNAPNLISAGAHPPKTPLGELKHSPDPLVELRALYF